ncbi:MAG TPA: phytoene desaturase family protein, partial [Chthonomonadaceae bacterium]|nr:phytoene desaturase family protein [Chthonomonadaceae bacterium]
MKVNIIGGGLAGLAAAVRLAGAGHQVSLFEKNSHLGGKMNVWQSEGFTFDMGPTIITLPAVIERLFASVGRRMEDYLQMVSLDPQWRTFFTDGSRFDLYSSLEGMAAELGRFAPGEMASYLQFLSYAHRMYDISEKWFFWKPWGSLRDVMRGETFGLQSLSLAAAIDPMTSMHQAIRKHFRDPRLAQLFEHFVQYVGSSPFIAPAILCLIPWVQIGLGCWYPMGGTGAIARALTRLCEEFGVEVYTGTAVEKIEVQSGRAVGVVAEGGKLYRSDVVIANSDIVRTLCDLLPQDISAPYLHKSAQRLEPACSGVVLYLGCRKRFPNLLHHNFFFSSNADAEFRDLYERRIPHADPTIYLALPSRTDPIVAPEGCEAVYALVHTPYLSPEYDWETGAQAYQDLVLDKMERCGMTGLRESILTSRMITPLDLEQLYWVNKGAIYGVVTKRGLSSAFKTGNRSRLPGLYFAGGSVNPGAGVPMVLMSGQVAAQCVLEDISSGRVSAVVDGEHRA